MAQVGNFPLDTQGTSGPLQAPDQNRNQLQQVPEPGNEENEEDVNRTGAREETDQQNPARTAEDRVELTPQAQAQAAEAAQAVETEDGEVAFQQRGQETEERGAAQRLQNAEENNARGFQSQAEAEPAEEGAEQQNQVVQNEVANPPENDGQDANEIINPAAAANVARTTVASEIQNNNPVQELVEENQRAGVQQGLDRPSFQEASEEQQARREAREAAEDPLLEVPDSTVPPAGEGESNAGEAGVAPGQANNEAPQPNPAPPETEVGQNFDRLI